MLFGNVNILAVIVAAILKMILGAIWYSPSVFGKVCCSANALDKTEDMKPTTWQYAAEGALSLLMALVIALFVNWTDIGTIPEALTVAFFLWLGFVATTQLCGVIWGKCPINAFLVHTSFVLLALLIMTTLITVWL